MANSYFQFKQFTIQQDQCAMKVTTDGCLFGAIVAKEITEFDDCKILDIGTGTGLLSLMVAQENLSANTDAIEIDENAADQAKQNVLSSPWRDRIQVLQRDILDYQSTEMYDVIISNPPFYEQQLSSPKAGRQLAHHSSSLTLEQLFVQVKKLLKEDGRFYVLLPFYRANEVIELAKKNGLHSYKNWLIKQSVKHDFFRIVFCFISNETVNQMHVELSVRDEQNKYSNEFVDLLKPFYLKL